MIPAAPNLTESAVPFNPLLLLQDTTRGTPQELDDSLKPAFLALLAQLLVTTNVSTGSQIDLHTAANQESSPGPISGNASAQLSSTPVSLPHAPIPGQIEQILINAKSAPQFLTSLLETNAPGPGPKDGEIPPANSQQPQPSNPSALPDVSPLLLADHVASVAKKPADGSPLPQQLPDARSIQPALPEHSIFTDTKQQAPTDAAIPTEQHLSVHLSSISLSKLITRTSLPHTVEHVLQPQPALTSPAFHDFMVPTFSAYKLASLHVQEPNIHFQRSTLERVSFAEAPLPANISSPIASPHTTIPADRPGKPSSEVEAHLVASQVTSTILRHVGTGEHTRVLTIHLSLEPPDLGAVQIHLNFQGSTLEARLEVENPNTLTMLSQQREHLHNTLEQSGINVRTLVISFQGGETGRHPYREENEQLPIKKPNRPRSVENIDSGASLAIEAVNLIA
jgi:flagellar hook-length control protein FliK